MLNKIYEFKGVYRFLSNFYSLHYPIFDNYGISYLTVEHAFQAAKTFDSASREFISRRTTPSEAKRAGRHVALRPDWENIKVNLMYNFILQKFTKDNDLQRRLLATGNAKLIEGNTWGDRFWGVCNGTGLNMLGELLEAVRETIRDGNSGR